jgi:hypothetical protein
LNEKKLGAIIVLVIAAVAPAMILGGYVANALETPNFGPMMESIAILQNRQINETPQTSTPPSQYSTVEANPTQ